MWSPKTNGWQHWLLPFFLYIQSMIQAKKLIHHCCLAVFQISLYMYSDKKELFYSTDHSWDYILVFKLILNWNNVPEHFEIRNKLLKIHWFSPLVVLSLWGSEVVPLPVGRQMSRSTACCPDAWRPEQLRLKPSGQSWRTKGLRVSLR